MNSKDTKEARIANLNRVQESRKQQTLEKVELALDRMQKMGMKINFSTLAQEANVSQSYLYKYPEIKTRIAEIRNQQSSMPRPRNSEPASAKSNQVIVSRLKERIKNLEAEVKGLRNINEGLAGRVYRVSELEALVERQEKRIKDLETRLKTCESCQREVPKMSVDDSKVTSIDKRKQRKPDNSDKIQSELDTLGIRRNSTLLKLIKAVPEEVVLKAIDVLKEALAISSIRNPSGFLVEAIRNTWTPNEGYEQKVELDVFQEWYPLAQSLGLVIASTRQDGILHVITAQQQWIPFEQIFSEYPLERLQKMVK